MRRIAISMALVPLGLGLAAASARATFHLEMVNEVMLASGTGDSSVQFVELLDNGGLEEIFTPLFAPYKLVIYDAAGNMLGQQTLDPNGLRTAADADKEYLISTPAADSAFAVRGNAQLTVPLPATAGQACYQAMTPPPVAYSCLTWGQISKPIATNVGGTGVASGAVPANGLSDQRQSDKSVIVATPTPGAANSTTPAGPPQPAGSPTVTHVSLAGLARRHATLRFTANAGSGAPGLERIRITLPGGLSFRRSRRAAAGVAVTGTGGKRLAFTARRTKRSVTLALGAAAASASVTVGHGAIAVGTGLAAKARHHHAGKLTLPVSLTDAGGTVTKLVSRPPA
jgi:hypothetical protein